MEEIVPFYVKICLCLIGKMHSNVKQRWVQGMLKNKAISIDYSCQLHILIHEFICALVLHALYLLVIQLATLNYISIIYLYFINRKCYFINSIKNKT